ncbi:hypothetical protein GCM10009133_09570 [Cocleimonas flava]|uniref:Coiled coil domain-containing protein n=1 Tax=Cocleimonas flava TaxID=634765 RepID=A0A4R1F4A1_9GAMM|nr:hypothetical protein [Cocleimonas flava]TCJ87319.1 hypothetical protein EV695_1827 [Cocleimonas flava]
MDTKHAYIKKMKAQLDELEANIGRYQAKADQASADAEIEYKAKVEELKEQRTEAKEWLDKVADASDDAWDSLKDGFTDAYDRMKKVFS